MQHGDLSKIILGSMFYVQTYLIYLIEEQIYLWRSVKNCSIPLEKKHSIGIFINQEIFPPRYVNIIKISNLCNKLNNIAIRYSLLYTMHESSSK